MRTGAESHLFIHTERLLKVLEVTCTPRKSYLLCAHIAPVLPMLLNFHFPVEETLKALTVKHWIYHTCVQFGGKVWARWCSPAPYPKASITYTGRRSRIKAVPMADTDTGAVRVHLGDLSCRWFP